MSDPAVPIYGLILTGGSSSRMRRDKAVLEYPGGPQLDRAYALVGRHLAQVFVSVRGHQRMEPTRAAKPLIVDSFDGEGPIVGIRSALAAHPDAAWLVIACDLPFLSDAALVQLLEERDSQSLATAFVSVHDELPEPLCTIWEPTAAIALAAYQKGGGRCPRKFLSTHRVSLLQPRDRRALENINTPEEYTLAVAALGDSASAAPLEIHVQYFALLREQAGRSEETLQTAAKTPADLFVELYARYGFTLHRHHLKVAVNGEFADWSRRLGAGDSVVFIPPVAGG